MLRYMISPIAAPDIHDGAYRAAVADVPNTNHAAVIPTNLDGTPATNPDYGKPKYRFALCLVATSNVAAVAAVSNAYVFPDYVLDGRMDGMEAGARAALKQSVEAYDLDGNGLHFDAANADGESYRDLITRIGQQLDPLFSINSLRVGEVAA